MRVLFVIPIIFLLVGCGDPLWLVPGGKLSGEVAEVPADWSFTQTVETVAIETNPTDPYSINIWGVSLGDNFYIAAARGLESPWVRNIQTNPAVRLRVEQSIYELKAVRTEDAAELEMVLAAFASKYDLSNEDMETAEADFADSWVFRLERH